MSKNEDNPEIITLEFDDDTSVDCEIMGTFDVEDKEYVALQPLDGTDDVYLYGIIEYDDGFDLLDIEPEDFDKVKEEFEAIMEDDSEE